MRPVQGSRLLTYNSHALARLIVMLNGSMHLQKGVGIYARTLNIPIEVRIFPYGLKVPCFLLVLMGFARSCCLIWEDAPPSDGFPYRNDGVLN